MERWFVFVGPQEILANWLWKCHEFLEGKFLWIPPLTILWPLQFRRILWQPCDIGGAKDVTASQGWCIFLLNEELKNPESSKSRGRWGFNVVLNDFVSQLFEGGGEPPGY